MVADGVGGGEGGAEASATALENAMEYVVSGMDCYYRSDSHEEDFINALQDAAVKSHRAVLDRARAAEVEGKMATTLTVFMAVWPWIYLMQVGDSRYYQWQDSTLTQVSRDQTVAQELVDKGCSRAPSPRGRSSPTSCPVRRRRASGAGRDPRPVGMGQHQPTV